MGPLLKTGLPLLKNVFETLVKSVTLDTRYRVSKRSSYSKKIRLQNNIDNSKRRRIWFIDKSVSEKIKNETKEQKDGFINSY